MKFVTIKPGIADGKPIRVPMPGGYGLPHGTALPAAGFRLPHDPFVKRLLADGDAVLVPEPAPAAPAAPAGSSAGSATSSGTASSAGGTVSSGGTATSGTTSSGAAA